jgi:FlaA1/EpsC-like NDP-sugar epimerase
MHTTHHTLSQSSSAGLARSAAAAGCRQRVRAVRCRCEAANGQKKVVVLGGTGRVGSATAASLIENFKQYDITVASRSQKSFENIMEIRPGLKGAKFAQCDISDKESVKAGQGA